MASPAGSIHNPYPPEVRERDEEAAIEGVQPSSDARGSIAASSESNETKLGSGIPTPPSEKTPEKAAQTVAAAAPGAGERDEAFMVGFDGPNDVHNPKNWSSFWRWYLVCLASALAILSSVASSATSGIAHDIGKDLHFSEEVGVVLISVYLVGFMLGPVFWAPMSETYGRRMTFVWSVIGFTAFQVGCALAKTTAQMIIFRFLAGAIAVSPLSIAPAVVADVCHPHERAAGIGIFILSPLVGPVVGPIASGFIHNAGVDWRWMFWALSIAGGVFIGITYFTLYETYPPTLLMHKAKKLRKETGDSRWYAPMETVKVPFKDRARQILVKPWEIFFAEPMLICIHVYVAFQYGLLYLNFESYPVVFIVEKGYSPGVGALPFLGIFVGGVLAILVINYWFAPRYMKVVAEHAPNPVPPEARLGPAMLGSVLFMISLFIFGWTSYPDLSWVGPTIAGGVFSFGVASLFISLTVYILDVYLNVAASALATNVVLRSITGASFPLFTRQMYEGMSPRWASTLLGFIALIMMPIPWIFVKYGPYLRSKSRYAPNKTK